MGFQFDESIPRWWILDTPIATHFSNGVNLLFPDGERFFIRSVKHYMDVIDRDPQLRARVRGFFGQEGRHGHEHERFNRLLEAQGYDIEPLLKWYRKVAWEVLEPGIPPHLRLAITAALEHFTATMARNGLQTDILEHAHPTMRALLLWHACEEIEHKSVAFDVLQRVDPRYSTRVLGLLLGSAGLFAFWAVFTSALLRQEKARGTDVAAYRKHAERDPRLIAEDERRRKMFREAFLEYLQRDFHPDQNDDYALAAEYLASVGRLDG